MHVCVPVCMCVCACVVCGCICVWCMCVCAACMRVQGMLAWLQCTYQVEGDVNWVSLKNWREALCLPHLSREDHVRWVNTVW